MNGIREFRVQAIAKQLKKGVCGSTGTLEERSGELRMKKCPLCGEEISEDDVICLAVVV